MSKRGLCCIGLHQPKFSCNVGAVLRAAGCYGADSVSYTGRSYKKSNVDTRKQYKHMPLLKVDDLRKAIPYDCIPIAIDIIDGARPLTKYTHPESAFYIFGPEDGTLGKKITDWCRDIVYIPTDKCMNLAATVNVVLYDRMMKSE